MYKVLSEDHKHTYTYITDYVRSLLYNCRLPMFLMPAAFTETLRLSVSIKRINLFLNAADLTEIPIYENKRQSKDEEEEGEGENAVEVRKGGWLAQ